MFVMCSRTRARFVCSRGSARVTIEPSSHETQYPQLYPLQDTDDVIAREELQVPNREIFI